MKIAIAYENGYGYTAKIAEAAAAGARSIADTEVVLVKVGDDDIVDLDSLNTSDGIVFGSPTCNGALGWRLKRFFEGTTGPV